MKGNILIVDDTPENLQVLSATLSREGYKVRGVVNGFMSLRVAKSGAIDLILLDIKMPDMNGYEVCEKLKSDTVTSEIPVIFISALDAALDKVRAFQVGGNDYITKPFQVPEVLARVKNQLTIRRLQQERQQQNQKLQQEIEERKKAELAADRALRAKSEFLTNMSHELRTPLNVILGFTQLMGRDTTIEKEQRENLNIINRSGEHLLSLINDILDLSKIESGAIIFQENAFDLYQLLDNLEAMFLLAAERKGIRLSFAIAADVPHYIKTDEKKLRGCLINLLNNAIKFTDSGSVMLRVFSRDNEEQTTTNHQQQITNPSTSLRASQKIYFAIEDTGCGIAAAEIERLFEAFVQAEAGRKAVEGTGLGLTITRQFITLMGGKISVRSDLGQGSIFEFYIVPTITETLPPDKTPTQRAIGLKDSDITYRILVVDDTRENCLLLKKLLQPLGFNVREAVNGKEAIAIWETWYPHLILMDTRMPIVNGYEATREIRKREKLSLRIRDSDLGSSSPTQSPQPNLPNPTIIIALTASIFEEQRGTMLEAGCNDFIHKPFQEATLLDKIAVHLGLSYCFDDRAALETVHRTAGISERSDRFFLSELKKIPRTWVKNLYRSANEINEESTLQLIEEIRDRAPALAEELQDLYDDSRFDIMVRLTQKVIKNLKK